MDVMKTASSMNAKLQDLDSHLRHRIRGQDHILDRLVSILKRGELGLTKLGRPKGSFLFLGPTGVGKTETAITFTTFLFGSEKLFRFDMSEYQTQESLGILLGSKPGERGTMGLIYDRSKSGTLLFDEIEKAHPRVLDVFLQILDAGRISMANGDILDLSDFYVVFTSNLGSSELLNFQHSNRATVERHVLTRAQQFLRPELFARISEKLVFHSLSYDCQWKIADQLLEQELAFLKSKNFDLQPTRSVLPFIVQKGFHPKLGARPLRYTVEKLVGDAIASDLLAGGNGSGTLFVDETTNSLIIQTRGCLDLKPSLFKPRRDLPMGV